MVKNLEPKKHYGQHFLVDLHYCKKIVQFSGVSSGELVIEIGPGTGQLTQHLIKLASQVIAVEIDPVLIKYLEERFQEPLRESSLSLIQADILKVDWAQLVAQFEPLRLTSFPIHVVGNLPYNIATHILTSMTQMDLRFQSYTFMTQREVAARVLAVPGTKDYGYLTLLMDLYYQRERGAHVPAGAFWPRPEVVSQLFRLLPRPTGMEPGQVESLLSLIKAAFRHRRKTLWNNLNSYLEDSSSLQAAFEHCGVDRKSRPEQVSLHQYKCIVHMLSLEG